MKRSRFTLWSLFVLLTAACAASRPLARPGSVESALPVGTMTGQPAGLAMKNPAAVYCAELGYTYQTVEQADGGQNGVCHLPDGTTCSAWAFLRGQCGAEHSICARHGLQTVVRSDGQNPFSREYAVCVDGTGHAWQSATEMADLMTKSMGGEQRLPFGLHAYGPDRAAAALPIFTPLQSTASGVPVADVPSSFDWRDDGGEDWMTPVKDQGVCGSCWAFGAVGALEATAKIDLGVPDLNLDLSEQYLVTDCALNAGSCTGGWHTRAFDYIRDQGIPDEGCLPYGDGGPDGCTYTPDCGSICTYSGSGVCSDYQCSDRCDTWAQRLLTLQSYTYVPADETAIKEALIEHGPLAVGVSTRGSFGADGIYRCPSDVGINHIVVLVGYDDASGGYWILKNSHGTDYGEGGYYKMAYDTCRVQDSVYAVQTGLDANGVTLTPPGGTGQGQGGEVVTYRPWVVNHTGQARSFDLSLSGNQWPATLSMAHTRVLNDGESVRFSVRVTVPADAMAGDADAVTVTAVTSGAAEYSATATFATVARVLPQVEVSPATLNSTLAPGSSVVKTLDLHNPTTSPLIFTIRQAQPTGAALLLSLDETGAAELFLDGSGKGNHGVCSGDSCPRAGVWSPRGKAAQFDGVQDRVVTPVVLDQSASSPGATMMAWIYPTGTSTDTQYPISTDDGGYDWSLLRWFNLWHVQTGDGARKTDFAVEVNRWQHVAAVFEPSQNRIRFYKNGQEEIVPYLAYDDSSNPVVLGDNAGPWEAFFEGRIDEVQVYKYPLSAAQVRAIYHEDARADWLSWDVSYGRVFGQETRTIQFTLDASGLSPDTYSAQVAVISNDPDGSRVNVPVTMVVANQLPEIEVLPASLSGELLQGESMTRTLSISNTGTGDLTFHMGTEETVSAQVLDAYWIILDPTGGTVSPGGEQAIQVTLDAAGLPPDTYNARIHVYSNDPLTPALDVPVTLTVVEVVTEGTVQGTVTDADTGAPLTATVSVLGQPDSADTGPDGAYELTLDAGSYTLQVTATGYVSQTAAVSVVAGETTVQDFSLSEEAQASFYLYLPLVMR